VAIEERTTVRGKIRDSYRKHCETYEKLLEMVTAIDEELIFATSVSRLEYFKTAIDWENRLLIKRRHLNGQIVLQPAAKKQTSPNKTSVNHEQKDKDRDVQFYSNMVPSSGKTTLTGSIVITTHTEPNKAEYFSPSTANSTTSSNNNNNNNNTSSTSTTTTTTVIVAPSVHLLQKDTDEMRDAEEEQEKRRDPFEMRTGEDKDPGVEGLSNWLSELGTSETNSRDNTRKVVMKGDEEGVDIEFFSGKEIPSSFPPSPPLPRHGDSSAPSFPPTTNASDNTPSDTTPTPTTSSEPSKEEDNSPPSNATQTTGEEPAVVIQTTEENNNENQ